MTFGKKSMQEKPSLSNSQTPGKWVVCIILDKCFVIKYFFVPCQHTIHCKLSEPRFSITELEWNGDSHPHIAGIEP